MRIERAEKVPIDDPLAIILETQEEVDLLYAIFNFTPIHNALELDQLPWIRLYDELHKNKSDGYKNSWKKLNLNLKKA